jgi:Family of unknown function (DUF6174)
MQRVASFTILLSLAVTARAVAQPARQDSARVLAGATSIAAFFRDTGRTVILGSHGRTFDLRRSRQRDSLRVRVARERRRWRARKPTDYAFLLRVSCFCPGQRGWLLMAVRQGQPLQAWDPSGKNVALTDWNTLDIDALFDNLERSIAPNAMLQVMFDPRWHFASYVHTTVLPGPDMWGTVEARGFAKLLSTRVR